MTTTKSWKEICDDAEGPEERVLIYDFDAPKGSGKFYAGPTEDGTGIYDDSLTGGESGE